MDLIPIVNGLAIAALAFMSFGIFKQWHLVWTTRVTSGISLTEVSIRFTVTYILLVKILLVGDIYLIIGQILLAGAITLYLATLLLVRHRRH